MGRLSDVSYMECRRGLGGISMAGLTVYLSGGKSSVPLVHLNLAVAVDTFHWNPFWGDSAAV